MATQPVPATETIFHIPLADIQPSKHNPRQNVEEGPLADLAADIGGRGVQEPVLLRPIESAQAKYEIVFGERRFLASEQAKRETIPAIVRPMSDEEARELRITENLQREDLHPLEWAAALFWFYKKRIKETRRHDDAIAFVSAKFHKPPETVARLLKLNDLLDEAKNAFREGKMLAEHACEIARLRQEEQKQALQWILAQQKDVKTDKGWKKLFVMPGVAELKLWIRQNLFLNLAKAPFDTTNPELNPKMGACAGCQFRTGSQPALFGDISKSGDHCTVPSCWTIKRNAALVNRVAAVAKELGVSKILKIGIGYPQWNHEKAPVDAYVEYHSETRIVKKGTECPHTQPGCITWIGNGDPGPLKVGDTVHVCTKAQTCPMHNKVDSRSQRVRKSYEEMADTRVANLRKNTPQRVRAALIRAVIESARKQRHSLSATEKVQFDLAAAQMHSDLFFDRHRDLCKLLDVLPPEKKGQSKDWRGTSAKIFAGRPLAMMIAMVLMHHFHADSYYGASSDPLPQLLRVFRVKTDAVEKQIKAEIAGKIESIQAALKRRKAKGSAKNRSTKRTAKSKAALR